MLRFMAVQIRRIRHAMYVVRKKGKLAHSLYVRQARRGEAEKDSLNKLHASSLKRYRAGCTVTGSWFEAPATEIQRKSSEGEGNKQQTRQPRK